MSLGEFDLIRDYFTWDSGADVATGVGDDAAVVDVPVGQQLVITTDTLIRDVHFPAETAAFDIGYKSLAVSLSDLAAMGAAPRWFTLALTLPQADEQWLAEFSAGLKALQTAGHPALVGGDTTRGPLTITIQAMGLVQKGKAVLRANARVGDDLYVTGTLGDAALGLRVVMDDLPPRLSAPMRDRCVQRLNRPRPRVRAGCSLAPFVSAMIDCSDGFLADLEHILQASGCGAEVDLPALPLSVAMQHHVGNAGWQLPLSGGDDYELIFTADPGQRSVINGIADLLDCPVTPVGRITSGLELKLIQADHSRLLPDAEGFTHF